MPLSVSHSVLDTYLKAHGIQTTCNIAYSKQRDENGKLTELKNGNRFIYANPFSKPLPRQAVINSMSCLIFHKSQEENNNCKVCNGNGHRFGPKCPSYQDISDTIAFRTFKHLFSNMYPCPLTIEQQEGESIHFNCLEQAYQYQKALDLEKFDARLNARHGGAAKKLANDHISKEESASWGNKLPTMRALVKIKAKQVPEFANALCETGTAYLAEANPDSFWASGLYPKETLSVKLSKFPDKNMLGIILMEERNFIKQRRSADEGMHQEATSSVETTEETQTSKSAKDPIQDTSHKTNTSEKPSNPTSKVTHPSAQ